MSQQTEEGPRVSLEPPPLPSVTPEVLRTAAERHQKGLMAPWVYQVLSQVGNARPADGGRSRRPAGTIGRATMAAGKRHCFILKGLFWSLE